MRSTTRTMPAMKMIRISHCQNGVPPPPLPLPPPEGLMFGLLTACVKLVRAPVGSVPATLPLSLTALLMRSCGYESDAPPSLPPCTTPTVALGSVGCSASVSRRAEPLALVAPASGFLSTTR